MLLHEFPQPDKAFSRINRLHNSVWRLQYMQLCDGTSKLTLAVCIACGMGKVSNANMEVSDPVLFEYLRSSPNNSFPKRPSVSHWSIRISDSCSSIEIGEGYSKGQHSARQFYGLFDNANGTVDRWKALQVGPHHLTHSIFLKILKFRRRTVHFFLVFLTYSLTLRNCKLSEVV